jgi:hypothetical protein
MGNERDEPSLQGPAHDSDDRGAFGARQQLATLTAAFAGPSVRQIAMFSISSGGLLRPNFSDRRFSHSLNGKRDPVPGTCPANPFQRATRLPSPRLMEGRKSLSGIAHCRVLHYEIAQYGTFIAWADETRQRRKLPWNGLQPQVFCLTSAGKYADRRRSAP